MKPQAGEMRELTADAEFRRILSDDPELARLRKCSYDRALESRVLLEVLGLGDFRIGALPVRPLTIARIALLWLLGSPFVTGGNCTESDLDVALYILAQFDLREIPVATSGIRSRSRGRCRGNRRDVPQRLFALFAAAAAARPPRRRAAA